MGRGTCFALGKTELGIVAKRSEAELAHSVDLSRIPEKTKLHCSPQMEASVSWVTALISSFLLLPLLSGAIIGGLLSAAEPASKPGLLTSLLISCNYNEDNMMR